MYFFLIKLELKLSSTTISFRFFPLFKKFRDLPIPEIQNGYIVQHRRTKFYSIYGLNLLRNKNYFVLQNKYSLRLQTKSGEVFFIGTRHPKELNNILNQLNILN